MLLKIFLHLNLNVSVYVAKNNVIIFNYMTNILVNRFEHIYNLNLSVNKLTV